MKASAPFVRPQCDAKLGNERTSQEQAKTLLAAHQANAQAPAARRPKVHAPAVHKGRVNAPAAPTVPRRPCSACGVLVSAELLNDHVSRWCPNRKSKRKRPCPTCGILVSPARLNDHISQECPKRKSVVRALEARSHPPHQEKRLVLTPNRINRSKAVIVSGGLPSLGRRG